MLQVKRSMRGWWLVHAREMRLERAGGVELDLV